VLSLKNMRLMAFIVLPVVLAAAGMVWNTSRMLDGISLSVNQQDDERNWQAVQSSLAMAGDQLSSMVGDNAQWNDAVEQSYGEINHSWMFDTWGVPTTGAVYDTFYIVDSNGSALVSYHQGKEVALSPQDFYGPAVAKLLNALPRDASRFAAASTLVNTRDGLAVMAAGPILPTSDAVKMPAVPPRIMIMSRHLDADSLAQLGKQFTVDGLKVAPLAPAIEQPHLLNDKWGSPVAAATWARQNLGTAARQSYRFGALATVLALLGAMIPISFVHWRSIATLARNEAEAVRFARRDSLSGLPNRLRFMEELAQRLPTARPGEAAVMFIDLDGFKNVNDAYDHETGDKLIKRVAAGLAGLTPRDALLARFGGDEFAMLMARPGAMSEMEAVAEAALSFAAQPFNIDGKLANIGASIGLAGRGDEPLEAAELMRRADVAMYDAKESGRNRVRHFSAEMDARRERDLAIAAELRDHLENGRLEVAFQPMVDASSREIRGVEALARWPKSSARSIAPDCFIHIAEEHGLIEKLGLAVMRIAFARAAAWPHLKLAVNVSPMQLNQHELVRGIARLAEEMAFPLNRLEVEFTENVLIKNHVKAKQVIAELHAAGATVALDDFGTGYASVGYLRDYGFDTVKIDRSLTRALLSDISAQQIVQGTVLIAQGLSAAIVAEGVETEQEATLMRLAGCRHLQGYLFGKPVAAEEIDALLAPQADRATG
jgi:diguanylate cyclase (GGDEF)-like protein